VSDVPTAIRLDLAANEVHVTWADGLETHYSGPWLRHICPCARCRGHAPGEVEPPSLASVEDVRVLYVEAVGTYAVRFQLSDGHDTGIYSFAWLRSHAPAA
jgi:DUF971 family protein